MKILLVHPSQSNVYHLKLKPAYPPLGVLYVAACLRKEGHELKIIDYDNEDMDEREFKTSVLRFNPDLVGFTSTTATINHVKKLAKDVKEILNVAVIAGGIHATVVPEDVLKSEHIDFVVIGEGEITICELVDELQKKKPDFSGIKGIGYKTNNKMIYTAPRPMIKNLDELPFPARDLLKNEFEYIPPDSLNLPATSVFTSRGCYGTCTYCCTKNIFGRMMRFRSAKNVVDEMELLLRQGYKDIHVMDDNFTMDKKRVLEIRDEMKKRNIKTSIVFGNGLRADMVDEEILQALKDMGVLSVGFGVESGNPGILRNVKKGISMDTVRKAYKMCKKMGFETWGFFIIGLPGDTEETVMDTINFAKELEPDFAKFMILKPYPNSEVFKELDKQGLVFDFNYEHYGAYDHPVHNLKDLKAEDLLRLNKKAYRMFYLRPKKILQHIFRIRNLTQLKLNIKASPFVFKKLF